jgi:hypothetical protein
VIVVELLHGAWSWLLVEHHRETVGIAVFGCLAVSVFLNGCRK